MALPNQLCNLPISGNGHPIQTGSHVQTGVVTLGTGTGTDDVTIPRGAIVLVCWSTVSFIFKGIGATAGTEIDMLANVAYSLPCAGADASTWKAFFNLGSGGAGTVEYYFVMGATP